MNKVISSINTFLTNLKERKKRKEREREKEYLIKLKKIPFGGSKLLTIDVIYVWDKDQ